MKNHLKASVALAALAAQPAWAQQAAASADRAVPLARTAPAATTDTAQAPDAAAPPGQDGLGDIVVTARRVGENLQKSPVAITAFNGETLRERAIDTVADVGKFTPSLNFDQAAPASGSSNSVTVFLRGIGQTDFNLTVDPGVGIYLDGVYISRSVGALLQTRDVENIQVLRGPQGTLFGKNTIGGAVIVTSKRPGKELGGQVEVTTGSYDRLDAYARINVPVSDSFRFYLSGLALTRDGYVRRLIDGARKGNQNSYSARLVAAWDATPDLDFLLSADYSRTREQAVATTLRQVNEGAAFPVFNNIFKNAPGCLPPSPVGNRNCYNRQWLTGDPYTTNESGPNRSISDVWGAVLTGTWHLGDVTLKSITAYRDLESAFAVDIDQSPIDIQRTANDYDQTQFSQELQLQGEALQRRLNYLLGLYYLREKGRDVNSLFTAPTDFTSGGAVKNDSFAAFSQVIFRPVEKVGITLGGRFTHEIKRFTPNQVVLRVDPAAQAPLPPGSPTPFFLTNPVTSAAARMPLPLRVGDLLLPNVQRRTEVNEFTPSVTLDYRFSGAVLGYFNFARGFKSGGFTQRVFPPEPEAPSFNPEFARVFEIGLKTELFDRRLRVNVAAFDTKYTDLQIIVADGLAPKVRNAGRASIRGVEVETQAKLARWLQLTGATSYLDARYKEVDPRAFPVTTSSRLANTPEWTASAGATVTPYTGSAGRAVIQGDWAYRSTTFKDAINSQALRQPGYSVFNASATFYGHQGLNLTAGVTNLSDKRYIVSGFADLNVIGAAYAVYARPREWFVRLGYSF